MAITRRAGALARARRPKTAREARLAWRPRSEDRIVRWVGSGRRASPVEATEASAPADPGDHVVALTWSQTFGQPARRRPAGGDDDREGPHPTLWRSA